MAKKTRAHRKWANDSDYRHKLSGEALEFFDKFIDEYYREDYDEKPLHNPLQQILLHGANNAANRCIMCVPRSRTRTYHEGMPLRPTEPSLRIRFLFVDDYCLNSNNPEEKIIDLIDENKNASSNVVNLAEYLSLFRKSA